MVALVPYDFLTGVFSAFAPYMGDYQKYNKVCDVVKVILSMHKVKSIYFYFVRIEEQPVGNNVALILAKILFSFCRQFNVK